MNVHGSGCEPDCTFSCSTSALAPNACPGFDPCSVAPQVCQTVPGPGSNGGQKCVAATALSSCEACATSVTSGGVCTNHVCKPGSCGDGCRVAPETCDPPHSGTCDSNCQLIVCGDGKVTGNEQCDDGNTKNLDGCDQNCNFEQIQRTTSLQYSTVVDAFCPNNYLGTTVLKYGLAAIQPMTDNDVKSGTTSVIFKFSGSGGQRADLTGTTGPVVLGSLSGLPQFADAGAYDGTSDVDWWYTVDPATIDSARNALSTMTGTYTNKTLTAGPANLALKVNLSGSPAALQLWNAMIQVAVGSSSTPLTSTGGPPGHLASEHVVSTLTSFESGGVGSTGQPAGELCGNITAQSLSKVATPAILAVGGTIPCDANYGTTTNSLLDVLVGGCKSTAAGNVISPSAPDAVLATNTFMVQGGGGGSTPPYILSASNSTTHVVDTCKDSSSTPKTMVLSTCLSGLGYSSAFKFQTDRVIIKP
jgi:cysteine-rich repeat protein